MKIIEDCTNIRLRIKMFGYRSQGESIVFELLNDVTDELYYFGCIDSYSLEGANKTLEYLNTFGDRKLDFLCWSHPDDDHSKGLIDIYKNVCNENTCICITDTIDHKLNKKIELSESHREIYEIFEQHNHNNKGTLYGIGVPKYVMIDEILFVDRNGKHLKFELMAIAPNGGLVRDWKSTKKETVKNILSIGLEIKLGEYKFIFSGDMPNESIEMVYAPLLIDPVWLKLPHHGSDSSGTMANRITYDTNNLYCCTTVNISKNRPLKEILDLYMNNGCTRIDSTHTGGEIYGTLEYYFDLFSTKTVKITHQGNACKIRPIN